jgi:hypothetical protein
MPLLRPRVVLPDKSIGGRMMVAPVNQDSLLSAIVKWIPIEILTIYKTVEGLIPEERVRFHLGFMVFSTICSALWIAFATKPSGKQIAWRQVVLAPIAFSCWAVAIEGSTIKTLVPAWSPWMGSLLLGAGTMILPIIDGILMKIGIPQNS